MAYETISVDQLTRLQETEKVLLIDLRDSLSYRCAHLPNALNVQPGRINLLLANVNKSVPVVLYCDFGDDSPAMAELFDDFGFESCYCLDGGFEGWMDLQQKGRAMSKGVCEWLQEHNFSCDDLNMRGYNGETALMFAARNGKTEYLVQIIDKGADIDAVNNDGNSAVWLACYANDKHSLAELIRVGANLNVQNDNGATPLIYAASAGRLEMVAMLLGAGADPFLTTLDEFSALDVASTLGILKLLKKATTAGRDVAC